jgi:alanyl-tRNA synthetase
MMKNPYPELGETAERVARGIKAEEASFLETIDAGLDRIERIFQQMHRDNRGVVSGEEAAEMYQTHGFPPELFESMAAERGLAFDWPGYEEAMRQHGIESGGGQKQELFGPRSPLDALKKAVHATRFVGYETTEVPDAKLIGLIASDQLCDQVKATDQEHPIVVVLDRTPFYGEMGGQVGDTGELVAPGVRFEVIDTQANGELTLHRGHLREGELTLGATLTARVNAARRQGIRRAHTATHLLHYALQEHLGKHAQQQGSKVDQDWLRFDFSNPAAVSAEQLEAIEEEVNAKIRDAAPVGWKNMPLADARSTGAMMLFGEKYPDVVRVVSVGDFSKELCGGTHLDNTGQVGLFKILSEESVAAGTRRITASTGATALTHVRRIEKTLAQTAAALKVPLDEVPQRVETLAKEIRQLKKQVAAGAKAEGPNADALLADAADVHGVKVVVAEIAESNPQAMREIIDKIRHKAAASAVLLAGRQDEGKVLLVAGLSRELVKKGLDAVKWVKSAAAIVGGGGGGRPDMAQAGGKDSRRLPEALETARGTIRQMLGPR